MRLPHYLLGTHSTGTWGHPGEDDLSVHRKQKKWQLLIIPLSSFNPSGNQEARFCRFAFVCFLFSFFYFFQERVFSLIHGWPSLCFFFPWCSAKCYERCDKTDPLLENEKRKIKKLHTLDNPVKKVFCLYHWEPLLKLNYLLSVGITTLSINI